MRQLSNVNRRRVFLFHVVQSLRLWLTPADGTFQTSLRFNAFNVLNIFTRNLRKYSRIFNYQSVLDTSVCQFGVKKRRAVSERKRPQDSRIVWKVETQSIRKGARNLFRSHKDMLIHRNGRLSTWTTPLSKSSVSTKSLLEIFFPFPSFYARRAALPSPSFRSTFVERKEQATSSNSSNNWQHL